jgi:protein-disulfide isomerase
MSNAAKPLIVIVLAVAIAAGAGVYLSRQPETVPESAAAPSLDPGGGGGNFRGPETAEITLVEFGDYQCPSCRAYHPVVQELLSRYPDKVRLEFHHYPLISIHPNALTASMAVEAAGEQGKYWEMHDMVFEFQPQWSPSSNPEGEFLAMANRIGLDSNKFMQALRSPEIRDRVLKDVVRAREANIEAVPTFFIDGEMIHVPLSIKAFVDVVEARLKK